MAQKPVCIDFETEAIEDRPKYPPKPVGVSIYHPGQKPKYLAWGHPTQNNVTERQAALELKSIWRSGAALLFQNAAFDLEVAFKHFGLEIPPWHMVHDTLYLLFLSDPHARSLSLKPAAERLLGMPPEEADAVRAWLVKAGVVKPSDKRWGAHISKAPGKLVGEYAIGDVVRTRRLYDYLLPKLDEGMRQAYDRERRLMPILLENERRGIVVQLDALADDCEMYRMNQRLADEWLRKRLKSPSMNLDSNDEVAAALEKCGIVTEWDLTPTGKKSTAKKTMTVDRFKDKEVFRILGYRNRLETCLGTFMEPWRDLASANGGRIFTRWNQVRGDGGGARTGRMSCSPNFQNIPKTWDDKNDGYAHPTKLELRELPLIRKYVLPDDKRSLFLHRDYNQQELRILAHFEDDRLAAAYRNDPTLDVHTWMQNQIQAIINRPIERRPVKILNFLTVYGGGTAKLAEQAHLDMETAGVVKRAQAAALPGLPRLQRDIKLRVASQEPVRTWGGRLYYCEPPAMVNGRMMSFEYKLLNYLIQGSAADCTKEAIIRYHDVRKAGRFMVTVHDEINLSCPKGAAKTEMKLLAEAMESVEFDVHMLSDGKTGPSWGDLSKEK